MDNKLLKEILAIPCECGGKFGLYRIKYITSKHKVNIEADYRCSDCLWPCFQVGNDRTHRKPIVLEQIKLKGFKNIPLILDIPKKCRKCLENDIKLRCTILSNGIKQYNIICLSCHHNITQHLSRLAVNRLLDMKIAKYNNIDDIPVLYDYRDDSDYDGIIQRCIVCNDTGVEEHHWLPTACAKDMDWQEHGKWPTAYLCKEHHLQWHKLVTPYIWNNQKDNNE